MIRYSRMTLREAYDAVTLRAGEHRGGANYDWDMMTLFINRAIREVMVFTLPYKDWGYTTSIQVTHGTVLPVNFIRAVRVLAAPILQSGAAPMMEARRVDAKEWFMLTDWSKRQAWNAGTRSSPIYSLWSLSPPGQPSRISILLYPNTTNIAGTAPLGFTYPTDNMTGLMDAVIAPPDLVLDTDLLPVPYEFEDLVVLSALTRLLRKTADNQELYTAQGAVRRAYGEFQKRFAEARRTARRELDSYAEPVIPFVPPQQAPGEAPQRVV